MFSFQFTFNWYLIFYFHNHFHHFQYHAFPPNSYHLYTEFLYWICFHALDILQKIEKTLLRDQHEFLSSSTPAQNSLSNLQQKAKELALAYEVPAKSVKQINRWLKLFIRKHIQFRKHFKYKLPLEKDVCNLNGLVTSNCVETNFVTPKNGLTSHSLAQEHALKHLERHDILPRNQPLAEAIANENSDTINHSTFTSLQEWIQSCEESQFDCTGKTTVAKSEDPYEDLSRTLIDIGLISPDEESDAGSYKNESFQPVSEKNSATFLQSSIPSLDVLFSSNTSPARNNSDAETESTLLHTQHVSKNSGESSGSLDKNTSKSDDYVLKDVQSKSSTSEDESVPHISTLFCPKKTNIITSDPINRFVMKSASKSVPLLQSRLNEQNTSSRQRNQIKSTSSSKENHMTKNNHQMKRHGFYNEEEMSVETSRLATTIMKKQGLQIPKHFLRDFSSTARLRVAHEVHEDQTSHSVPPECLDALFEISQSRYGCTG